MLWYSIFILACKNSFLLTPFFPSPVTLERGIGVERDSYHAAKWYQQAAKLGFPDALCALGRAYERGAGVPVDPAKAAEMFGKAAEVCFYCLCYFALLVVVVVIILISSLSLIVGSRLGDV